MTGKGFGESGMSNSFGEVETAFLTLRRKFRSNEISRREFIDQLKKLRLRDSQGRFWMIGAQSGKWHFFDGREWVQSSPPEEEAPKVKCLSCGLENTAGAKTCERCGESLKVKETVCPRCGTPLENSFQKCPACSRGAEASPPAEEVLFKTAADNSVLRRLNPASLLMFSGGAGLILGVILGAVIGAAGFFPGMAKSLPDFLSTLHGTLMGGIIYAVMGGLLGFALLGVVGYLEALLFNAISSILGGFRLTLDQTKKSEEEDKESF
ncbi:MAG TPA: zinc ribbon domain-containing protein [Candidatus Desulfaltia sp.]|nr:zinc ribbon domain-containing protein [Candidatus Desulfaltia sp.]